MSKNKENTLPTSETDKTGFKMKKKVHPSDVIVCYIKNPSDFYVRRKNSEDDVDEVYTLIQQVIPKLKVPAKRENANELIREIEREATNSTCIEDHLPLLEDFGLEIRHWVLARSRQLSFRGPFHRGEIIGPYYNAILGLHLKILFVDHGCIEWVHIEDTRQLPKEMYGIRPLARHCKLYHFYPNPDTDSDESGWSKTAKDTFVQLSTSTEVSLEIMGSPKPGQPIMEVDLIFYPTDGQPASVRDIMLFEHHGCLDQPSLHSQEEIDVRPPPPDFRHLPIASGSWNIVRISCVISPDEVYVQPLSLIGGNGNNLRELSDQLKAFYGSRYIKGTRFEVFRPVVNSLCVVRSSKDRRFYRCKIEHVPINTHLAQVFMVDIGRREIVGSKDLFYLCEDSFLDPFPYAFGVRVSMDNLQPVSTRDGWPDDAISFLKSYIGNLAVFYVPEQRTPRPETDFKTEEPDGLPAVLFSRKGDKYACINGDMVGRGFANCLVKSKEVLEQTDDESSEILDCQIDCRHPKGWSEPFLAWINNAWK